MGGQSTNIGQSQNGQNIQAATQGLSNQNSNLNSQYDLGNASSLINSSLGAAETNATNNAIAQTSGQIASQKGINPAMAARLANQNAAQQSQQGVNSLVSNASAQNLQAQGLVSNNLNNVNSTAQSGINTINSSNASTNNGAAASVGQTIGAVASLGSAAAGGGAMKYNGGVVGYAHGGQIAPQFQVQEAPQQNWGSQAGKGVGTILGALFSSPKPMTGDQMATQNTANVQDSPTPYAHGGKVADKKKVPSMVSPGEIWLPPKEAAKVAQGKANPMKVGEKIPGKAAVKGDSPKNDTVPKKLEEGGVVIPRSVFEAKNPHKEASKFVAAALMHHKLTKKYGK